MKLLNKRRQLFFSVVIPTLNEEAWLPNLLSDLKNQTYKEFEVIVVDGNSEDKTKAVAKRFQRLIPNLKVINSNIRNVSVQRNLGAKQAKGKYLLFVDADSGLLPFFLTGIKYRVETSQAEIFTTWCQADSQRNADKAIAQFLNLFIEASYQAKSPGALGAMLGCKKEAFDRSKGFNANIAYGEDGEFVRRCYKNGYKTLIFRDPMFIYSLRRIRKAGTIKSLQKYAKINIKMLLGAKINGDEYPMGGRVVWKDEKTENLLKEIKKIFDKVKKKKIFKKIYQDIFE